MPSNDPSLRALLRDLITEVTELVRQEFRLAQVETSERLSQTQHAFIAIAAGLLLAFCALLIVLQALVVALAEVMPPWAASLAVGGAVAVIAFVLVRRGQHRMSPSHLVPERTIDSMRRDRDLVLERVQP